MLMGNPRLSLQATCRENHYHTLTLWKTTIPVSQNYIASYYDTVHSIFEALAPDSHSATTLPQWTKCPNDQRTEVGNWGNVVSWKLVLPKGFIMVHPYLCNSPEILPLLKATLHYFITVYNSFRENYFNHTSSSAPSLPSFDITRLLRIIEIQQPESNLRTPAMNCCEGMQCLENADEKHWGKCYVVQGFVIFEGKKHIFWT